MKTWVRLEKRGYATCPECGRQVIKEQPAPMHEKCFRAWAKRARVKGRVSEVRYILNSAVITAPGTYSYRIVDAKAAAVWLRDPRGFESTVGYPETAAALEALCGVEIPVNRRNITMRPGDEALVFRLVLPPGTPRIDPRDKGRLTPEFVAAHCEIGRLRRTR